MALAAIGAGVVLLAWLLLLRHRPVEVANAGDMLDALVNTGFFASLPADASLIAPALWEGVSDANAPGTVDWTKYLSRRAGRPVHVWRQTDLLFDLVRQSAPVFYCQRQWLQDRRASALLLYRLHEAPDSKPPLASDSIAIVSPTKLLHLAVEYRSSRPEGGQISDRTYDVPLGKWREQGGAFLGEVYTPGCQPGTALLVDDESGDALQAAVDVLFQRGFTANTERNAGHYYRWSDGADGEAGFDLVNTRNRPLTVRFQAVVRFNPVVKTGTFELISAAGTETVHIGNGGLFERVWTLEPGSNAFLIKCHEPRVPAPGDLRYIVFGFWDWSLSFLNPPAPQ